MVWKAISSITLMIWLIDCEDSSMTVMAETACSTTSPERRASSRARLTTSAALLAPVAVWPTVTVISSIAAAVSSRLAA